MERFVYVDEFGIKNYTTLYKFVYSFVLLMIVLTAFSTTIWYLEKDVNPKFETLLDSFWYGHAVVTTIGFGDLTPITSEGKIFTICSSIIGIILLVSMGQSLNDVLFGHTETGVLNRELRAIASENKILNKTIVALNEEIVRTNLLALKGNDEIAELLRSAQQRSQEG